MKVGAFTATLVVALLGACTGGAPPTPTAPATMPALTSPTPSAVAPTPRPNTASPAAEPASPAAPAEPPVVGTVTLSDEGCTFNASGAEPAATGFVIEALNETGDDAGFDLWLLHADTTYAEWVAYHEDPPGPPHGIAEDIDLMEAVDAGSVGRLAAMNPSAGVYALQCWRFATDGDALMTAGPFTVGPGAQPSARGYHAMVDVPGAGVLLFGGFNTSPPEGGHPPPDFWSFTPAGGWRSLEGSGCTFEPCVDGYPDVVGHAVYDPDRDRVVLVHDTGRGTFTYDPATGAFADLEANGPSGAAGSAVAYDDESRRVILFGGLDFSNNFRVNADTWSFDAATSTWIQMEPAAAPGIGNYHQMAYDPRSDRMILFGGASPSDTAYGETWAYDYNSDSWTNLQPQTAPAARYYGDMVYDPVGQRMVLFGGTDRWESATFDDTWAYDPATNVWSEVATSGPSDRAWHAMAYDDDSGLIVLFGGGLVREDYVAETWLFDPAADTWAQYMP